MPPNFFSGGFGFGRTPAPAFDRLSVGVPAGQQLPLGDLNSNAVHARSQRHTVEVPKELRKDLLQDLWPQQPLHVQSPLAAPGVVAKMLLGPKQAGRVDQVQQPNPHVELLVAQAAGELARLPGGQGTQVKSKCFTTSQPCNRRAIENFMTASNANRVLVVDATGPGYLLARILKGFAVAIPGQKWKQCREPEFSSLLERTSSCITIKDLAQIEQLPECGYSEAPPAPATQGAAPSAAAHHPSSRRVSFAITPSAGIRTGFVTPLSAPAPQPTPASQLQPRNLSFGGTPHPSSAASAPAPPSTGASSRPEQPDLDLGSGSESELSSDSDNDSDWESASESSDDDQLSSAANLPPISKPVPPRKPLLGEACWKDPLLPEECAVTDDPAAELGLHLSDLPRAQASSAAAQPTTSKRGSPASKLGWLPFITANMLRRPHANRGTGHRDPDYMQHIIPSWRESDVGGRARPAGHNSHVWWEHWGSAGQFHAAGE